MKKVYLLSCLLLVTAGLASAQLGNYRSSGLSSVWSNAASWEVDQGSGFVPASQAPNSNSGTILIQSGHTMAIGAPITIDQVTVNGTLDINGDVSVTLANGAGDDLVNNGTINILVDFESGVLNVNAGAVLRNNTGSTLTNTTASSINFAGNSTYHHDLDGGTIPSASWSTSSICYVTGVVGATPTNFNQNFGNLIWESPNHSGTRVLGFTTNKTFAGSIDIRHTGTGTLAFTAASITITTTNFLVSGSARFALTSSGNTSLNVTNYTNSSDNLNPSSLASTGTGILNVSGSFTISGLNGLSGSGTSELRFTGVSQTYSSSVTFTGLNIRVNSGTTLDLNSGLLATDADFEMQSNATLLLGSQSGAGAFSPSGNVDAGTYTIAAGANFTYDGGTQTIGSDFTFSDVNITVSNNTTLSQNAALTISSGRTLTINSGSTFSIGAQTLTINGTMAGTGTLNGGGSANLTIGGTGVFGSLVVSNNLNNLVINRTGGGAVTLGSNLLVGGTFTHTEGDLDISGRTLTLSGAYSSTANASLTSDNASSLIISGSGALGEIPFASNALNTLTLNRSGATLTTDAAITITNLNLTSGNLANSNALAIAAGGTITRNPAVGGGSMAVSPNNTVNAYNVVYNGAGTTGPELTTSTTAINNVTKQGSGILNLNNNITVNGTLSFASGTFNGGTRTITVVGGISSVGGSTLTSGTVIFAGNSSTLTGSAAPIFGALTINSGASLTPSVSYGVNGALTNNGTLNAGSGITVTFGGATTITGNVCSFNNVVINGTLNGPANINVSGNWEDNGTFVRGAAANTVTFNGTTSLTGGNVTNFSSIAVSGTLNAPTTLNIAGNLTNTGTFVAGTGTVVFNGSSGQTVGGGSPITFANITMSKSGGTLTFNTPHSLSSVLTLTGGTLNPNGNLTLLSSASGDARIAQITGGASISLTNLIVQRYLPNGASNRTFRYITAPVTGAFVSGIKDDTPVTGTFSDPSQQSDWPGIPNIVSGSPSMYRYNELLAAPNSVNDKWQTYPLNGTTSASAALEVGRGYSVFVRQTAPITIDLTGTANFGQVPVQVTAQSNGGNDGFNLIGNPYPSPINWANVTRPAGVSAQVALKDNSNNMGLGAGQYIYYTAGGAAIPADYDGTIASGQAFWVRTTQDATINFQEDDKQPENAPTFIREKTIENIVRVKIAGNSRKDELLVAFDESATDNEDADFDALKLQNDFINLSSLSADGKKLAINFMGALNCNKEISLSLDNVAAGSYSFSFEEFETFSENIKIRLVDTYAGATVELGVVDKYDFAVTADARTFGADRFKLSFNYPELLTGVSAEDISLCPDTDGLITLTNSQVGVKYFASLNGQQVSENVVADGTSTSLLLAGSNIAEGDNTIVIYGQIADCPAVAMDKSVNINKGARYPITEVSNNTRCQPGSVTLTASGAPDGGSYRWYASESDVESIEGQTTSTFTTPELDRNRSYFVSAVSSNGCEGPKREVTATVIAFEEVELAVDGLTLSSSYDEGNRWYKDGQLIEGASGQNLTVSESGLYEVELTFGECSTRAGREMVVTSLEVEGAGGYSVYPNPVKDKLTIEVNGPSEVRGFVMNSLGTRVGEIKFQPAGNKSSGNFSLEGMPEGFYIVNIRQGNKVINHKIVKK